MKIFTDNEKYFSEIRELFTMLTGDKDVSVESFHENAGYKDVRLDSFLDDVAGENSSAEIQVDEYLTDNTEKSNFSDFPSIYITLTKCGQEYTAQCFENGKLIFEDFTQKNNDEKEKNAYKRLLFSVVKNSFADIRDNWGILTGIRPVKIVNNLKKCGKQPSEIVETLKKNYLISDEKIRLITRISHNQARAIKQLSGGISIYIFIPFCPSRCYYCSFYSNDISVSGKLIEPYLDALEKEIGEVLSLDYFKDKKISSIYVGGGTPSSLDEKNLARLLDIINKNFDTKSISEFTFEAGRADTLSRNKLQIIKDGGANRLCINPQTMNDDTLSKIKRTHTSDDFEKVFCEAREVGFDNINSDLILGLYDEDEDDMRYSLKRLMSLEPENITLHTLSEKRKSYLAQNSIKISDFDISLLLNELSKTLFEKSYEPYYLYRQKNMIGSAENVGFARQGKICLYNIAMMDEVQSVIGFGAGASTKTVDKDLVTRVPNYKDVILYSKNIDKMISKKKEVLI